MANAAVGDRVLVTLIGSLFEQRLMSTFCYTITGITGTPSQASLFTALHAKLTDTAQLVPLFRLCVPEQYEMVRIWYQVIAPTRYAKFQHESNLGLGLLDGNEFFSPNQAAVIVRRGDLGSRSNISTLHVPLGQTAGCQANGGLGGDVITPLGDLAAYMVGAVTTSGTVATLSPSINNGPGIGDVTPIVQTFLGTEVRTMRRRTVGRGI